MKPMISAGGARALALPLLLSAAATAEENPHDDHTQRGQAKEPATPSALVRSALSPAEGLVGATGFPGGAVIYGFDYYAWSM